MASIWSALVPETTMMVDKFLTEILAELGKEMRPMESERVLLLSPHQPPQRTDPGMSP